MHRGVIPAGTKILLLPNGKQSCRESDDFSDELGVIEPTLFRGHGKVLVLGEHGIGVGLKEDEVAIGRGAQVEACVAF